MTRLLCLVVCGVLGGGCLIWQDEPHLWPGQDIWNLSAATGHKAAKSTWTGKLDRRDVFDINGTRLQVTVLVDVTGLNPRDQVSSNGSVTVKREMPGAFYLAKDGFLVDTTDYSKGLVRVSGTIYTTHAGGGIRSGGHNNTSFSADPTTQPVEALFRLQQGIWPVILVEKIEPAPARNP